MLRLHPYHPTQLKSDYLDPETSDEIMQLLFNISKDYGTAVIMATHDFIVISKYPSRMLKTERGQVFDSAKAEV